MMCINEKCKKEYKEKPYYFCPYCGTIYTKQLDKRLEKLFVIISSTQEKILNFKKQIKENGNLQKLFNDLLAINNNTYFQLHMFYHGMLVDNGHTILHLKKLKPKITKNELESVFICMNISFSRLLTTDVHFTFDGFFNKIYSNYVSDNKYSFYSGIPKIFNELDESILEEENPFLALSCLRNSLHNYSIYNNPTKNRDKSRNTNNDLKSFSIDNYFFEFKHNQYVEYGPFFIENFLIDKMIDKMEKFL